MKISVKRIFWTLTGVIIGLLVIYTLIVIYNHYGNQEIIQEISYRFNVNGEANIPAWYSTILLFSVSTTAYIIYRLEKKNQKKRSFRGKFWLFFAIVFSFLSLDEAAKIHELIDKLTSMKWIFIYAPLAGIFFLVCLYYVVVIRKKDITLLYWVIGGLVMYAMGGLVSEWVSYTFYPLRYSFQFIEFAVEEGLEMMGSTMVLVGCLQELNKRHNDCFKPKMI